MTTQTQEVNQAIVLSESQFPPSYVEDSQPPIQDHMPPDSDVFEVSGMDSPFVLITFVLVVPNAAAVAAAQTAAAKTKNDGRGNSMMLSDDPPSVNFPPKSLSFGLRKKNISCILS